MHKIIIGGGLAGSLTTIYLSPRGHDASVREMAATPSLQQTVNFYRDNLSLVQVGKL